MLETISEMDLEERLLRDIQEGREVPLERALLIVSGLETEEEIDGYIGRLDRIHDGFRDFLVAAGNDTGDKLSKATALFDYLWETKQNRYNGNFLFNDVIDAQLANDADAGVGDCLGLTSLYTVLGLREGLEISVLRSHDHTLNRLRIGDEIYDIENTDVSGFGIPLEEHKSLGVELFRELYPVNLLAQVYSSRGFMKRNLGDFEGAVKDHTMAVELDPKYALAYNNRGIAKRDLGDLEGAVEDYTVAICMDPGYALAYNNRGVAKVAFGDWEGAVKDWDMAIGINPKYALAYNNRGIVKEVWGDLKGAKSDYTMALELDPSNITILNNLKIVERNIHNNRIKYSLTFGLLGQN